MSLKSILKDWTLAYSILRGEIYQEVFMLGLWSLILVPSSNDFASQQQGELIGLTSLLFHDFMPGHATHGTVQDACSLEPVTKVCVFSLQSGHFRFFLAAES